MGPESCISNKFPDAVAAGTAASALDTSMEMAM